MMSESGSIFSIPELRLCMHLSGHSEWDDLPLVDTNEPAEQRIINAFLHLIQLQRFLPGVQGYEMESQVEEMAHIIGDAEEIAHLCLENQIATFLYRKKDRIVAVVPDLGHVDHCKVHCFDGVTMEEAAHLSGMWEESMLLHPGKRLAVSTDQNDLSRLAFYLTDSIRMEENE